MKTEAQKLYMAEYRKKNAEKIAAQAKVQKAAYYAANKAKVNADNKAHYERNKDIALARNAAYVSANREKVADYQRQYADTNRAQRLSYYKARFQANREELNARSCAYAKANKGAVNARNRAWARRNPMKIRAANGLRKGRVRQATPAWADKEAIKCVYQEAHYMQMQVDHIIPLSHPQVCGLHVWDNLQLLSETANKSKGNNFDIEACQ